MSSIPLPGQYGAVRLVVTETNLVSEFINIFDQVIDAFTLETPRARLSLTWTNNLPGIDLRGPPRHTYITEASTNLIHWTPIATNLLLTASTNVPDTSASNHPARLYRARTER